MKEMEDDFDKLIKAGDFPCRFRAIWRKLRYFLDVLPLESLECLDSRP